MIKTFKSTGIGNEAPFDEETAEEWRRKKEKTRRLLERNREVDGGEVRRLQKGTAPPEKTTRVLRTFSGSR